MGSTREGRIKQFCRDYNIPVSLYNSNVAAGLKWCYRCKTWRPLAMFAKDKSRWDGYKALCKTPGCDVQLVKKSNKGRVSPFKGKQHGTISRAKMSEARIGNKNRVGKQHTAFTRLLISIKTFLNTQRGSRHYGWKGGVSVLNFKRRGSIKYRNWRAKVYSRDRYTCQHCGDNRGGNLEAHHIKPFALYPGLRYDVNNGLTLCKTCHYKLHYGQR